MQDTFEALDRALAAVGDFADLRSTWTRGRSTRLAEIARAAGAVCGLPVGDLITLGRAALVADLKQRRNFPEEPIDGVRLNSRVARTWASS